MKDYSKTIETKRLILRKLTLSDAEDIFSNYASHDKVSEFLSWQTHKSIEDTKLYLLNSVLPDYEKENTYRWAIVLKDTNNVIGCIDVVRKDLERKRAEIGYVLSDYYWGNGIMSEAGKEVIKYLFEEGFVRVQAIHDVNNPKSGRVMQKIGMEYEGTLKKYEIGHDGKLHTCKMYAIIND